MTIKEYFPADYAARGATSQAAPRSQGCAEDYKWGLERFIEEARTLATFVHPNIVRVHRYFLANNTGYMVLAVRGRRQLQGLAEGPRARAAPARARPHPGAAARRAGAGAQRRLPAPRHRPDNIIIRKDGSPVLIDFGSARGDIASHSQDRERSRQAGLQPLRAVRHHQQQAGAVDRHLCARRHALSCALRQAAARCPLAHGQRRIRAGPRCRAQLLPSRDSWRRSTRRSSSRSASGRSRSPNGAARCWRRSPNARPA